MAVITPRAEMIAKLKASVDLLALVQSDTSGRGWEYRKASKTGQLAGPCPLCGEGTDRFCIWPETNTFHCRRCSAQGSVIDYVMHSRAKSFETACDWLKAPDNAPIRTEPINLLAREPMAPPPWQAEGLAVVAECESSLWGPEGEWARGWLNRRGLSEYTLKDWRIGYNPTGRKMHGLEVSGGVIIPGIAVDGQLWYIKTRLRYGKQKYVNVKPVDNNVTGGHPAMLGRLSGRNKAILLCEGEFDCMLADQSLIHLVDVATFGSVGATPGDWLAYLLPYERVLVAYDVDAAGNEGADKWSWTKRYHRAYLPLSGQDGANDLTDYHLDGGHLWAWLLYHNPFADDAVRCRTQHAGYVLSQRLDKGDTGAGYQRLLSEVNL